MLLEGAGPGLKVNREEVFGPVCTLAPFDDFAQAVRMANDSPYGLQAGVFTRDVDHAMYAFEHLEVGGVIHNDYPTFRTHPMPYGGVKRSSRARGGALRHGRHHRAALARAQAADGGVTAMPSARIATSTSAIASHLRALELLQLRRLSTPAAIQTFLNSLPYSSDSFYRSPLTVLRDRVAHCFDGAVFAAMCLLEMGHPLILELLPNRRDDDHILALFRESGRGGPSRSPTSWACAFREPIFRTLRVPACPTSRTTSTPPARRRCEATPRVSQSLGPRSPRLDDERRHHEPHRQAPRPTEEVPATHADHGAPARARRSADGAGRAAGSNPEGLRRSLVGSTRPEPDPAPGRACPSADPKAWYQASRLRTVSAR